MNFGLGTRQKSILAKMLVIRKVCTFLINFRANLRKKFDAYLYRQLN